MSWPDTEFDGAATLAARQAGRDGPWDESDTVMLNDDSPGGDTVVLQPYNSTNAHDYAQDEARPTIRLQMQFRSGTLEASAGMIRAMDVSLYPKTLVPALKQSRAMRMGLNFENLVVCG